MMSAPLTSVVLAAGEGTRMRSARPKPLHLLCGRAMLLYVLDALAELAGRPGRRRGRPRRRAGHQEAARAGPARPALDFVEQHVQRGTGDAAQVALTAFPDERTTTSDDGDVLVLPGDTPLLRRPPSPAWSTPTARPDAAATLLTARLADPTGYGRVVRGKDDRVGADRRAGRRHRRASARSTRSTRRSTASAAAVLAPALRRLSPDNAQGEYYLTDVVEVLPDAGYQVGAVVGRRPDGEHGVNDRVQLAAAEAELRRRTNDRWLRQGVTMLDPERTYVDATVRLAADVTLFPGTILQGATVVGERRRDRARHPAGRLHGRAPTPWWSRPSAVDAEIGAGARGRARSPSLAAGQLDRPGDAYRAVLHCDRPSDEPRGSEPHGAGHQEAAAAALRALATRSSPRRSPTTSASSWARPTSSSSPTARSTAASASRSAAPTSSSSRPTARRRSLGQRLDHGAADHDRRRQAGVGQAHHRGLPLYGYARQDRKAEGREPITAKLVADMLTAAGANRIVSVDLHSGQIQGFFDGPVDHLTAMPVLVELPPARRCRERPGRGRPPTPAG